MAALPPGRSPNASTACSSRTTRKHPFQLKKKNTAGILKNESKDGFSGGASAGVPAQAAGLSFSHFLQKKFEFQRTKEPSIDFIYYNFVQD